MYGYSIFIYFDPIVYFANYIRQHFAFVFLPHIPCADYVLIICLTLKSWTTSAAILASNVNARI